MSCVPYTYIIGWSQTNTYYYGVRYAAHCNPSDLWVSYYTSSKYVKEYRELNGEPDIIQVRKTFKDINDARSWEEKVLKRINAAGRPDFLNKANGKAIQNSAAHYERISIINSRPKTDSEKYNMSIAKKALITSGKWVPENPALRDDVKLKMSASAKLRAQREDRTGINHPNFQGVIHTPAGIFITLDEVAAAFNISKPGALYRINSTSEKFKEYKRVPL